MPMTFGDLGACGCNLCGTAPCGLPQGLVHLAFSLNTGTIIGTANYAYGAGGVCTWQNAGCINTGSAVNPRGLLASISIVGAGLTLFEFRTYANITCSGAILNDYIWRSDGFTSGGLTLQSYDCSIPQIVFLAGTGDQFTVTW
jgi:hypothetical protein